MLLMHIYVDINPFAFAYRMSQFALFYIQYLLCRFYTKINFSFHYTYIESCKLQPSIYFPASNLDFGEYGENIECCKLQHSICSHLAIPIYIRIRYIYAK